MNIETPGGAESKEKPTEPSEKRKRVVEEVFRKYHKRLLSWCIYKLKKKHFDTNAKSDAEEIVASIYERLLTEKNSIDLTRSESSVSGYLNTVLDNLVMDYIIKTTAQKRTPKGGSVSLEEAIDNEDENEEDLSIKLKQYFNEQLDEEENYIRIEQAIRRLENRNPKMADIIIKRYQQGKTLPEIADDYGDSRQNIKQLETKALQIIKGIINKRIRSDLSIPKPTWKKQRKDTGSATSN